jgi:D-sedoheptulose 7-phosphate isomerase
MMDWTENWIHTYPGLELCIPDIQHSYAVLQNCFAQGGKLLVCGNGGSAADSEHIVGELMKGYMLKRRLVDEIQQKLVALYGQDGSNLAGSLQGGLPAISLTSHSALILAIANDISAEMIFAQQVIGYGRTGDVLWGLSTSGNARNIIAAFQTAKSIGMKTIALTGPTGGKLRSLADVAIRVPGENTPTVQEGHLPIYHLLCALLEKEFFS